MAKYRLKVIVEAEKYKPGMEDGIDCARECGNIPNDIICRGCPDAHPYVQNAEGKHYIHHDDWIITNDRGERYPIRPDIFEETYEPIEEANFNSHGEITEVCNKILPYVDDELAVYIEKILELAKEVKYS